MRTLSEWRELVLDTRKMQLFGVVLLGHGQSSAVQAFMPKQSF